MRKLNYATFCSRFILTFNAFLSTGKLGLLCIFIKTNSTLLISSRLEKATENLIKKASTGNTPTCRRFPYGGTRKVFMGWKPRVCVKQASGKGFRGLIKG
jgi:hypothetical protein